MNKATNKTIEIATLMTLVQSPEFVSMHCRTLPVINWDDKPDSNGVICGLCHGHKYTIQIRHEVNGNVGIILTDNSNKIILDNLYTMSEYMDRDSVLELTKWTAAMHFYNIEKKLKRELEAMMYAAGHNHALKYGFDKEKVDDILSLISIKLPNKPDNKLQKD